MRRLLFIICVFFLSVTAVMAQKEKVKNQPYADLKWFHLGFHVGLHAQDLILTNTGVATNGETWYAEIPSYSPGFSVGVIGDMYLNPYFNLRFTPTIHFGDKKFVFRRPEMEGVEGTDENPVVSMYSTSVRSNYLTFPLDVKYSAFRVNNYRPYLIGGIYGAFDLGRKKGNPILLKGTDFGVEFGIGCDIYLYLPGQGGCVRHHRPVGERGCIHLGQQACCGWLLCRAVRAAGQLRLKGRHFGFPALQVPGCLPGGEEPGGSGGREHGHLLRAGAGPSGL